MMKIAACQTYHAQVVGRSVCRMPDGQSVFKVYYLSNIGRALPEKYEWRYSSLQPAAFEAALRQAGFEGVGFITAFPHSTKVFRFSPEAETILDVRELETGSLSPKDNTRADGWHEFACYAEAALAAQEYAAWAAAETVHQYLAFWSALEDMPVSSNSKLAVYFQR